jgi:hypothetical protein
MALTDDAKNLMPPVDGQTYYLDTRGILVGPGHRKIVGGQEDIVVDVAPDRVEARQN